MYQKIMQVGLQLWHFLPLNYGTPGLFSRAQKTLACTDHLTGTTQNIYLPCLQSMCHKAYQLNWLLRLVQESIAQSPHLREPKLQSQWSSRIWESQLWPKQKSHTQQQCCTTMLSPQHNSIFSPAGGCGATLFVWGQEKRIREKFRNSPGKKKTKTHLLCLLYNLAFCIRAQ